jgi:hypothetical protein
LAYLDKAAYQHHPAPVPKEIYLSSYECDCGRQSHFFDDPSQGSHHPRNQGTEMKEQGAPRRPGSICMKKTDQPFKVGEQVIWWKRIPGGNYVFPVSAKVLAVTAQRVKIQADDDGEIVIRYVPLESLQRREENRT